MTLLAQHGWGKADKIDQALQDGSISGAILSPRAEAPSALKATAASLAGQANCTTLLLDPQFYASVVTPARLGKLPDYAYFWPHLGRRDFMSAGQYQKYATDCLAFQAELPVTGFISPTVRISTFRDQSSQVALQLADASMEWWKRSGDNRPLLLSFVIEEQAMRSMSDLAEFMDVMTLMECSGFYIIPFRSREAASALFEADPFASFLYMSYVLRVLNDFEVIFGYADLVGIALHAFGATHTATGWFQTLRHFTFKPFRPASGGRQPLPRYTSIPLLDSILLDDLDKLSDAGLLDMALSGTDEDAPLRQGPILDAAWGRREEALQHWSALHSAVAPLEHLSVAGAVGAVGKLLDSAELLYAQASRAGVEFAPPAGSHLAQWRAATRLAASYTEL